VVFGFSILAVASAFISPDVVYLFLQSIIGISNMVIYILYAICLICFRNDMKTQNIALDTLEYKIKDYPLVPYSLLILYLILFVVMAFEPTQTTVLVMSITTYIIIYIIGAMYYI